MTIGIDASRAFIKKRTGIEEYSYQVIKHLIPLLKDNQVVLYVKKNQNAKIETQSDNVKRKVINFSYLWTQLGLSLEMLFHPVEILFVPAHTVPFIHAKNTVVTIHGLEYEFCPQAYSFWAWIYMRWSIKASCRWARTIIAVSNNTKRDLIKLYKVPKDKIEVVYEAYENKSEILNSKSEINSKFQIPNSKFLLFIGRLEERKNIVGVIKAFEILKKQYKLSHKLVLAGNFGYGKEKIVEGIKNNNYAGDIILPGYVSEEEKWHLLRNADVFLFPTFYEGFGLPILEAQSVGCPVVAGNNSSIPEVTSYCYSERSDSEVEESSTNSIRSLGNARYGNFSAILVDPNNAEQIADAVYKLIADKDLREDIIKMGHENVKRFSWEKCAQKIAEILTRG